MHFVSLFVELVRTQPVKVAWAAILAQAALWVLVPALTYSAPPDHVPEVLAVGHEFLQGSSFGPPLAYWLSELAFQAAGIVGVYLLSQLCVVVAYGAVFALGRIVVGDKHAALAVLAMAGVAAFSVPTPEFGPGLLAMALWALVLWHVWRAIGQGRQAYWVLAGLELGLLLLTTDAGFVLLGLLLLYLIASRSGRVQLTLAGPWLAGVVVMLVFFPHLMWLEHEGGVALMPIPEIKANLRFYVRLCGTLIAGHIGLLVLVVLVRGLTRPPGGTAPVLERPPVVPAARHFVFVFALAPMVAMALLAAFSPRTDIFIGPPLVLLSGLAVIVAAPDRIRIVHQWLAGYAWGGLLVLPPLIVAATVMLLPAVLGVELQVAQPARGIGPFFADAFRQRTGRPLAVVAGDPRLAGLAAMTAPERPSLYLDATPARSPWVTPRTVADKGALVLWPADDPRGAVPADILARFPGLVAEVPRSFERRLQGRAPPLRIGWGIVAPR